MNFLPYILVAEQPGPIDTGDGFWFVPPASEYAATHDSIYEFVLWLSVFFFVLIVGIMVKFAWDYRRKSNKDAPGFGPTHSLVLETTWTVIPLLLSGVLFFIGVDTYADFKSPPANCYEVDATAQKWAWQFDHRNGASDSMVLKVPVGKPTRVTLHSNDVLHSFFIPAFRVKQDVVPGRYGSLWFTPEKPGIYQGFCTEYCGTGHSKMNFWVEAIPEEEFDAVIAKDARWIDDYSGDRLVWAGARLFSRCASCHSLKPGERMTGPSMWDLHANWGKTKKIEIDGKIKDVKIDENYVLESIVAPWEKIAPTYMNQMPANFGKQLSAKELDALVRFVRQLDLVTDENGKIKTEPPPSVTN
ncbi:MAG: cytochrome c oxidase subunit II [Flavobacteriales bacterium]|nr:cytochrome c oxidase subunit II [Flavobacteriales bacterium]